MKRLLILGGTSASIDILKVARKMGLYILVADDAPTEERIAKQKADEALLVSTTNMEELKRIIKEKKIDGVFCGPSEFNIVNAMKICHQTGLPFYCTQEQWDICSNKYTFKKLCQENNVPCVLEYDMENEKPVFPVIVKPVDGCSSKGLTVCYSEEDLDKAYMMALEYSESKKVVVEKYIQNRGVGVSVRYIAENGNLHLSLMGDRFVTAPGEVMTTNLVIYPSIYTEYYKANIDENVKRMFQSIGIKNGVLFMQALPEGDNIYFHEMGLRLSGGLPYVITEAANGINDVKMMLRYAVGEEMCTEEEVKRIDPYLNGKHAVLFSIPIRAGKIGKIAGVEKIAKSLELIDYSQYYQVGDEIPERYIGTTMQFFCRFKFFAECRNDIVDKIKFIQNTLCIEDINGKDMFFKYFDYNRILDEGK